MSDTDPAPAPPDDSATVTAGSADLEPELAPEPVAASVLVCPICGHAESGHVSDGRCLVMLGTFGTEGACPCPDVPADAVLDRRPA